MNVDQSRIDELISAPSESLNVEIKRWFNIDKADGIAKLIKVAFAIRNRNGGFFIIGFDDEILLPDKNRPQDIRSIFNVDKIQGLISKYASEIFEIAIGFGVRDGREYPIIVVPEGLTAPVAVKRDLRKSDNEFFLREGDIYFRTLGANGTPSSAKARPNDWRDILEICFDNREADIGRFLRRHLAGQNMHNIIESLKGEAASTMDAPTLSDRAKTLLNAGEKKFKEAINQKKLEPRESDALKLLTWSVALVINPPKVDSVPDKNFLNTFSGANPQYTGWPVWVDSRNFEDRSAAPKVVDRAWQALTVSFKGWSDHVDFMRLDPKGEFYLRRLLQDDLTDKVPPGTALDVILVILRVTEAIAVGLSFAKALGWNSDARLGFGFCWQGLRGRELKSWSRPEIHISRGHFAEDQSAETFVELSLDTPASAIAGLVGSATRDLFVAFNGYTVPNEAIEYWVQRLLERQL